MSFYAYYYSLEPTGNAKIDTILEAVARAGKMYHNTSDWDEESGVVKAIQDAANEAAKQPAPPPVSATDADKVKAFNLLLTAVNPVVRRLAERYLEGVKDMDNFIELLRTHPLEHK